MMDELRLQDDDFGDPDDHYEEYCEWLMAQNDLHICNGDSLVRHLDAATRFDEFLQSLQERK